MNLYVSAHSIEAANIAATAFETAGHEVVSTWHRSEDGRPATGDPVAWRPAADRNFTQIRELADAVILVASPEHMDRSKCVSGGKFVEAGYALAYDRPVYTVGGVENGMLHATGVTNFATIADLISDLATKD